MVLATADIMARRWPIFHSELVSKTPYQAIVSLPIDSDEFGVAAAVDLYYLEPRPFISDEEMEEIGLATDIIGALLVANSGLVQTPAAEPVWLNTAAVRARSQVWIALGMLNVALNLGPVDALATLRSYAYSRDTTIDEIARKITDRQLPTEALAE